MQFGFLFLILDLKIFSVLLFLIDSGTKDHNLGAIYDTVSVPFLTLFGTLVSSSFGDLRLYDIFLTLKTLEIISGDRPLKNL